ncbi:MAG: hypothetical protein K8R99_05665 [Actinomycetia bacterium]|nr:hypothetical protein [Actinomycetes bacterium]
MIPPKLTRRGLFAATGGALVLAACSSDSNSESTPTSAGAPDTAGGVPAPDGFAVVQRFPNHPLFTPGDVRLPVSLADQAGNLSDGPATLTGWIEDFNGNRITDVTAQRRAVGIEVPYWEVRANLPEALVYTMRLEGDDGYGATFELYEESDVLSPLTGTKLQPFDTPTVDDHRGVEPYCSHTPEPCPLHAITLTDALAAGTPVAYMIGTPAHCTTGTCSPGLEFLVVEHERVGDSIAMVHADVYADDAATEVAPAVTALNVQYEPIIYLCDADGVIVDRLDGIWDASELTERIDLLLS